ncbi:MAG: hypothetical protein MJA30_05160 [Cytophagales bacterium]|nr:hypothetical protein [Cytophagales bacterium]
MSTIKRGEIITGTSGAQEEIFPVSTQEETLFTIFEDIFQNFYDKIHFGPLIEGAAWEVAAPNKPTRVSLYDGYLTVDFGPWHFHICIGENKGAENNPTPEALKQERRTSRAEFYRRLNKEMIPTSWGFRTFNGVEVQQVTIFLPSPFYQHSPFVKYEQPDWSKLEPWDHLRKKYLDLAPEALDREGNLFF